MVYGNAKYNVRPLRNTVLPKRQINITRLAMIGRNNNFSQGFDFFVKSWYNNDDRV